MAEELPSTRRHTRQVFFSRLTLLDLDGTNMRILRGLTSRFLPCGCLAGIYETYDGEIVGILDARAESCADPAHAAGKVVPIPPPAGVARISPPPADSS